MKGIDNKVDKIYAIIREGVNEVVDLLMNVIGLNAIEMSNRMNKSLATTGHYLRILKKRKLWSFVERLKPEDIILQKKLITY